MPCFWGVACIGIQDTTTKTLVHSTTFSNINVAFLNIISNIAIVDKLTYL